MNYSLAEPDKALSVDVTTMGVCIREIKLFVVGKVSSALPPIVVVCVYEYINQEK